MVDRFLGRLRRTPALAAGLMRDAQAIDGMGGAFTSLSDHHLRERIGDLRRAFVRRSEVDDETLRIALAMVREAAARKTGMRPFVVQLAGAMEGKAWVQTLPGGPRALQVKQVARVEGQVEHPPLAVIKTVQVRVLDAKGVTRATHTTRL